MSPRMRSRDLDPDYQDYIAERFRCAGCDTPTRGGRLCGACREDLPVAVRRRKEEDDHDG